MKRILLVLSAVAFFCLHVHQSVDAVSVLVSVPFLVFFAWKRPGLAAPRAIGVSAKGFGALTAMGVCLWPMDGFAHWLSTITVFQRLQAVLGVEMALLSGIAAGVFAVAGLLFVYQMICLFLERLLPIVSETVRDFTKAEGYAALLAALALTAAVVYVYQSTDAFASQIVTRDLIYTSDSGAIVHENAYLSLHAVENDFRSPLFALFAAPLMGLAYLLGRILPIANAEATVLVAAQVPLLVACVFLLMKLIGKGKAAHIALPLAMLCSYGVLLFSVMAEQYVIALFYLSLGLYALVKHGKREELLILGAAGTMIPGAALALLPEQKDKKIGAILWDALRSALRALVLLFALGGFGVLWQIPDTLNNVSRFTGADVGIADRLTQFLSFVGQIFVAPNAGETVIDGYAKWRLAEAGGISVLGIVILALVSIGFVLRRRERFAQISMAWVVVSAILLWVLGWGTAENGLTLYTLYFGWAYIALLAYLAETVMERLRLKRFTWIVYTLGAGVLLLYNLPRLWELLRFTRAQYPL